MLNYTTVSTTCQCTVSLSTLPATSRRLATNDEFVESSGALELVSLYETSYEDFVYTLAQADDLTVADLQNSYLVAVMFAVMWLVGLLMIADSVRGFVCGDCFDSVSVKPSSAAMIRPTRTRDKASVKVHALSAQGGIHATLAQQKRVLLAYVDSVLPLVFVQKVSWAGRWREISRHHRYVLLFTASGERARAERERVGIQMLTVQTMLMFLLAVSEDCMILLCCVYWFVCASYSRIGYTRQILYDVQYPTDNGLCRTYLTQEDCKQDYLVFDRSEHLCTWEWTGEGPSSSLGECSYHRPHTSFRVSTAYDRYTSCWHRH
jgi:hypothetical protein